MVNVLEKLRTEAETKVEDVQKTDPKDMKDERIYKKLVSLSPFGKTTNKQNQEAIEQDEKNAIYHSEFWSIIIIHSFNIFNTSMIHLFFILA